MAMAHVEHRRRWIVAGVVVTVVIASAIGFRMWLTAPPRIIGLTETLERFREPGPSTSPGPSAPLLQAPAPGVYVYDTAGQESIDALGGDTHTYPAETAMTVKVEGCGYRLTWAPLAGRTESWLLCPRDGGVAIVETTTAHEFLRQSDEEHFTCDPGAWWLPPPGTTSWTTVCRTSDRVSTRSARVLPSETLVVGREPRDVVRVRYDDVLSAGSTGTTSWDLWLDRTTGLVLVEHIEADTRNDSVIGVVNFREHLDLTLRSVTPQR
jgi:hypothetical protein